MHESPRIRRLRNDSGGPRTASLGKLGLPVPGRRATRRSITRSRSRARACGATGARSRSSTTHQVEIKLGASYPRTMPEIRWLTPIYHPNISEIGMVCLGGYGTHWVPSVQLDELCMMLWDMARYHNYDIRSPYNRDAALWVANQTTFLFPDRPPAAPRPPGGAGRERELGHDAIQEFRRRRHGWPAASPAIGGRRPPRAAETAGIVVRGRPGPPVPRALRPRSSASRLPSSRAPSCRPRQPIAAAPDRNAEPRARSSLRPDPAPAAVASADRPGRTDRRPADDGLIILDGDRRTHLRLSRGIPCRWRGHRLHRLSLTERVAAGAPTMEQPPLPIREQAAGLAAGRLTSSTAAPSTEHAGASTTDTLSDRRRRSLQPAPPDLLVAAGAAGRRAGPGRRGRCAGQRGDQEPGPARRGHDLSDRPRRRRAVEPVAVGPLPRRGRRAAQGRGRRGARPRAQPRDHHHADARRRDHRPRASGSSPTSISSSAASTTARPGSGSTASAGRSARPGSTPASRRSRGSSRSSCRRIRPATSAR